MRNWPLYHCDGVEDILRWVKNFQIGCVWNSWWRSVEGKDFGIYIDVRWLTLTVTLALGVLRASIDFFIHEMRLLMIQSQTSPSKFICICTPRTVYQLVASPLGLQWALYHHVTDVKWYTYTQVGLFYSRLACFHRISGVFRQVATPHWSICFFKHAHFKHLCRQSVQKKRWSASNKRLCPSLHNVSKRSWDSDIPRQSHSRH